MKNEILMSSNRMDWETPQDFFNKLNEEFNFTLDPCCTKETAKCNVYFTPKEDGLKQSWKGHRVFCNPPYGRKISKWVKKAYEESQKGTLVVLLIPSRTDTSYWWDYCMKGEIRFIRGRLKFKGKNLKGEQVNHPATFPSAIIIFNKTK